MQIHVINFKRYESGAMVGFFDLAVGPLVVSGCKAFRKQAEDGSEKLWFAWPSQKAADKDGNEVWNDIVTAAPPVARHLQALVRPQVRRLLDGKEHADRRVEETRQVVGGKVIRPAKGAPTPEGEDLSAHRSGRDDIPF